MYPEGLTEMKKLSTNPQIKSADCGYRDYVYPTPTFLSHVLYIKKGSSGYTLDKCMQSTHLKVYPLSKILRMDLCGADSQRCIYIPSFMSFHGPPIIWLQ